MEIKKKRVNQRGMMTCRLCGKIYYGSKQSRFCSSECKKENIRINQRKKRYDYITVSSESPTNKLEEKQKNLTYAERQKANTLAMLGKIGDES